MTPTDPNILRAKFDIPPEMTLNVYYAEDGSTNILNGFNYFQPPQSEEQHIHLIKQRFDIPDNIKVSSDYVGNSINDISCEERANTTQFILLLRTKLLLPKMFIIVLMKNPSQLLYMMDHPSLIPLLAFMTGVVVVVMMEKKQEAMKMITPRVTTIV